MPGKSERNPKIPVHGGTYIPHTKYHSGTRGRNETTPSQVRQPKDTVVMAWKGVTLSLFGLSGKAQSGCGKLKIDHTISRSRKVRKSKRSNVTLRQMKHRKVRKSSVAYLNNCTEKPDELDRILCSCRHSIRQLTS